MSPATLREALWQVFPGAVTSQIDRACAVVEGFLAERDRQKFNEGYLAGREFGFKRALDAAVQRVEALPHGWVETGADDQQGHREGFEAVGFEAAVAAIKEGQA